MIESASGWYVTPTSVKAVVVDQRGQVLLGLNPRGRWELPGGWPEPEDVTLEETARREVFEETGLEVTVGALVTACLHHDADGADPVALVVLRASLNDGGTPVAGDEHTAVRFFHPDDLPEPLAPSYRQAIAAAVGGRSGTVAP